MSTSGGGCGSLDKATKAYMFEYQAPAVLNQAAPVQKTWYDILPATANVRVYRMAVNVEDNDETLEVQTLIDGETIAANNYACTHSTNFLVILNPNAETMIDEMEITPVATLYDTQGILLEGHNVQIQVRKTTAAGVGNLTGIVIYGVLTAI